MIAQGKESDQKTLQECDKDREDRYRSILDDHMEPICRFLPDGTVTFGNKACYDFFGLLDRDLRGSNFFDFLPTEQANDVRERIGTTNCHSTLFHCEYQHTLASGQSKWSNWTFRCIFDAEANLTEIHSVARDVTDSKMAELALKKSEARYFNLIRAIPDGVVAYDPEGRATYANDGFSQLYGWSQEEVLGRSIVFVPSEEQERTLAAWEKTFNGENVLLETKRITKDGRLLDIQLRTATLLDRDGNVRESIVIHRDITERKRAQEALQIAYDQLERRVAERTAELAQTNERLRREIAERDHAEKRFRAVFETAHDAIFLKDRNLVYTHVNPAFLRAVDLSEADVIGKTDDQLFIAREASYTKDLDYRVLGGQVVEATHNVTSGRFPKIFDCIRVPMLGPNGETIGICGIARDVTDRKALERRCPANVGRYRSSLMESTLEQIRLAAQSESIILLLGESGSGKDFLAKYLHDHSRRQGGPYFAINCAALAATIAESELFGHEPGSFTGSRGRKRGLLEMAEGGTLLLNEVGELSQELQAKLLTFLDTQSFTRVGGEKTIQVNARLVAATNRDLEREVAAGRFREDLFYRLNVFAISVPSLRERKEDLPFLARDIIRTLCLKLGRLVPPELDASALEWLDRYQWPGNVRELRNVLERAMILCRGNVIRAEDISLPKKRRQEIHDEKEIPVSVSVSRRCNMNEALEKARRMMVVSALERCSGNISASARLLGVSRDAVRYHIKALDIEMERLDSPTSAAHHGRKTRTVNG